MLKPWGRDLDFYFVCAPCDARPNIALMGRGVRKSLAKKLKLSLLPGGLSFEIEFCEFYRHMLYIYLFMFFPSFVVVF